MTAAWAVSTAVIFVWLGMVLAISFLETPLKFQAPGVTTQIGLGIGRLVFRALNAVETVLAVVLLVSIVLDPPPARVLVTVGIAIASLVGQLVVVRPLLSRRTAAVLAGKDGPRSHVHYAYVGLELVKVVALALGGILLLAA
ncbi:MAG: hypothetical protein ACR2FG_11895 [Marmoricola sp.]